ncbi:MAG: M14 metallopeptidase family protein [Acidobacteriota bacterium]
MIRKQTICQIAWLALVLAAPGCADKTVTTPQQQFGFEVGADHQLITYTRMADYWKKLEQESDRMKLVAIGTTAEGRTMQTAVITSSANHRNLPRFQEISKRLALAEGLTDAEARNLAAEGKAVVWIDGGLHATETVGAQQLIELVFQMVSQGDAETLRILDNVILLATIVNPDGMDLVGDWYLREPEPTKRKSYGDLPRLYHKYVGHDNNRDFYMVNMPETEAINRVLYIDWFPQIMYNHHQTGPVGSIIFMPPFRDPFNYNIDPLVINGIEKLGAAMHGRYIAEGKPGSVMRSEANYQTWWNGGARTSPYFHNMIGLLTEIKGEPTPIDIPFLPNLHLPHNDYPLPIAPQKWHYRQSIEYSISANRAVLDMAAKHREEFLFNIYQAGRNSIQRGSRDSWTMNPRKIAAVQAAIARDGATMVGSGRSRGYPPSYYQMLFDPAERDPRGYILPSDQPDFLTATKFVNTLIKNGVSVHCASQSFEAGGRSYPAGSYVIRTAQAFRPHILDMFEPQVYPDDIPCPGGTPKPPYDATGYTLAYQMGVQFDRIVEGLEGPFERVTGLAKPAAGAVTNAGAAGFLLSHRVNDAFIAINRLLADGGEVYWLKNATEADGISVPAGTIYIPAREGTAGALEKMAAEIGLSFHGTDAGMSGEMLKLRPVRIGLWDRYGGSMPAGWTRWLFEQYGFNFEVVFPGALDAGDLRSRYDVLVFVEDAIPAPGRDETELTSSQPAPETIPEQWRDRLGAVTEGRTIPELRRFLESGGAILAIGSSTNLAYHLKLPMANALVDRSTRQPLKPEQFYIPGSILQARVDNSHPLAYGMAERVDVYFDESPVFQLNGPALKRVAWFDSDQPLRSDWAWQQQYLAGGTAVVEASVGGGKLFLYGPSITFRGQPHGTFKFLFNGIYYGTAQPVVF